jgi:hypothetical protein
MKTLLISAVAVAAAALFTPMPSNAQNGVQGPGFGVQIGGGPYYRGYGYHEPYYGGYRAYDYEEPAVVQRRVYRQRRVYPVVVQRRVYSEYGLPDVQHRMSEYGERAVHRRIYRQRYVSLRGCRTVTLQRHNGMMKRIRRCG